MGMLNRWGADQMLNKKEYFEVLPELWTIERSGRFLPGAGSILWGAIVSCYETEAEAQGVIDELKSEEEGSGVLCVADGKGVLSFELWNVHGIPTTVVDPRPLKIDKCMTLWERGMYHKKSNEKIAIHERNCPVSNSSFSYKGLIIKV